MKWLLLYFFLQVVVPKQHAIPEVPAGVLPQADTTLGVLILVNKEYKLPKGYRPHDLVPIDEAYNKGVMNLLRSEAAAAFARMCAKAAKDSIILWSRSAYRSDTVQRQLYENAVERRGEEGAEKYTARPGYSEHQTGLTVDINSTHLSFGNTPEGIWLKKHAHLFGYIERYPIGKESVTGYAYEPWHYRYVGKEAAAYIVENKLTFEEYHERKREPAGNPAR